MMPKISSIDGTRSICCSQPLSTSRPERMQPLRQVLQPPGLQKLQDEGAQHHTPHAADATEHDHHQDHHRDRKAEHLGCRGLQLGDVEHAGHAPERRTDGERQQLELGAVDAHRAGGDLVLTDRHPGAADSGSRNRMLMKISIATMAIAT